MYKKVKQTETEECEVLLGSKEVNCNESVKEAIARRLDFVYVSSKT